MNLEDEVSDEQMEENWEFLKCDKKDCVDYGKEAICYFDCYVNCCKYSE